MSTKLVAPLHGLRGLAAMSVVVGHVGPGRTAPSLGVVLFFVLSGYLMGRLYLPRRASPAEVVRYVAARIGRVYPLFALVVLGVGALSLVVADAPFHLRPGDVLPHLLLAGDASTIWTVSVEFQFYAVFVLLWIVASALPPRAATGLVCALAVGLLAFALVGEPREGRIDLLRYLHIFALGLVLSRLLPALGTGGGGDAAARVAGTALPVLLGGYAAAFLVVPRLYDPALIYDDVVVAALCALLVAATILAPEGLVGRWLSSRPMFWLGEVSFGLYLLHRVVYFAGLHVPGLDRVPGALSVLTVLGTLALAGLAHRLVERPSRERIREAGERLVGRLRAPAAA